MVLVAIEQEKVDFILCLGDLVGYGANPNECISQIKERTDYIIAGNHDYASVGLTSITNFNPLAAKAALWTEQVLNPLHKLFLRQLPLVMKVDDLLLVHATPSKPEAWEYIFSLKDASKEFKFFREKICFVGHSHQPFIVVENAGEHRIHQGWQITLEPPNRYLINIGSIGQPRDGNPKAAYAIYDQHTKTIEIKRIAYNIQEAQRKIREVQLPAFLADRLATGE